MSITRTVTCVVTCAVACVDTSAMCVQLRHFFVDDTLHFGVYAVDQISAEEEITLPFDFHFEKWCVHISCSLFLYTIIGRWAGSH